MTNFLSCAVHRKKYLLLMIGLVGLLTGCDLLYPKETGEKYVYDESGVLREKYYLKAGVKTGAYQLFYENGNVHETCSFDSLGRRHGARTIYYIDGQKQVEEQFVNGKRIGEQIQWNVDGEVVSKRAEETAESAGN